MTLLFISSAYVHTITNYTTVTNKIKTVMFSFITWERLGPSPPKATVSFNAIFFFANYQNSQNRKNQK